MGFPSEDEAVVGDIYTNARGNSFEFTEKGVWRAIAGESVVNFSVGATAPVNPEIGDYWHDTKLDVLKVRERNATTELWTLVGTSPFIGPEAPENPVNGLLWYDTIRLNLYYYLNVAGVGSWKLLASSALSASQLIITKVHPLEQLYNDERINFELFVPDRRYTFRNIERRKVIEGINNDDSITIESTTDISAEEDYAIYTADGGLLDTVTINTKLTSTRLKLKTHLTHSYGATGLKDAYLSRTSALIPEEGKSVWRNGDIYFSKPMATLEKWPDGDVVIRRTAAGAGQFKVWYKTPQATLWIEAPFTTSSAIVDESGEQWRDQYFKVETTGIVVLRITYANDTNTVETVQHIAFFCGDQNNDSNRIERPRNVTPADNAVGVLSTPTLTGSAFRSIYGLTQGGAEFQVALDPNFSSMVVNTSSDKVAAWVAQSGQSATFNDIINLGNTKKRFLAAGDGGVVTLTMDGGKTWAAQTFGSSAQINAISANSNDQVIAVGASGMIRLSANNGGSWSAATAANSFVGVFRSVGLQGTNAIAVGTNGEIQRSITAGGIWNKITQPNSYNGTYNDVCLDINGKAIAVGTGGEVITSGDFGLTWTKRTPANGFNGIWYAVACDNNGNAVAVGAGGVIQRSTDFGATWQALTLPDSSTVQLNAVIFRDSLVVVVGNGGAVYSSNDKGATWVKRPAGSGSTANFNGVALDADGYGVIVGASGAVQYTLRLEGAVGTSYTVPAGTDMLKTEMVYFWRCRYQDSMEYWSPWSTPTAFATSATFAYIVQPQNLSPANNAVNIPLRARLQCSTFDFVGTTDAHSHTQWQVSTDAAFGTILYDSGDRSELTSFTLPAGNGMVDKGTYYWRCRHKGTSTRYSSWSVPTKFTAQNNPNTPAITAPTNNATNVAVLATVTSTPFSTSASDSHFRSRWQFSTVSNFATTVHDSNDVSALLSYTVPAGTLQATQQYYVRVQHIGVNTGPSAWSDAVTFTTASPNAPSISSPTNNAVGQSVKPTFVGSNFSSPVAGGESHIRSQWQVSQSADFATTLTDTDTTTALTSFVYPNTLGTTVKYYARVRYFGSLSGWSGWSAAVGFTTGQLNAPSITSPASGATGVSLKPTVLSSAFSSPTSTETHVASQWQISTSSTFATTVINSGESTQLTSYPLPSALTANTQYYARVRHKGSVSGWSDWSTGLVFTTGAAAKPTLTSPAGGVTNQPLNPNLTSSNFSTPTSGEAHLASQWQISTASNFGTLILDTGAVSNLTSYQTNVILAEATTYYARVRHQGSLAGWSDWSDVANFVTGRPAVPAITAPAHGSTGLALRPAFSSSQFSSPITGDTHSRSRWIVSTNSNFTNIVHDSGESTSLTSYTPSSNLEYSTTYYVGVAHKGSRGGWSGWSTATVFSTTVAPGEQVFTSPGTHNFTVPAGVTSVCVVCVGAGGGRGDDYSDGNGNGAYGGSGGGGGLRYLNNIGVFPGQILTVTVGASVQSGNGGSSSFGGFLTAFGGQGGLTAQNTGGAAGGAGGGGSGGSGGNGGNGANGGAGGGAGGYTGNGGNAGQNGAGGGGAGGAVTWVDFRGIGGGTGYGATCGGGVGLYGQGASGVVPGGGGSGGGSANTVAPLRGGAYGGGASQQGQASSGGGAVRIIWGSGRSFPSAAG